MNASGARHAARTVALLLLVATGCTTDGPDAEREPPARLEVSVSQFRHDEGTRNLRAAVTNVGDTAVSVTSATLAWPGFARRPVALDVRMLRPGKIAGFVMRYGEPKCQAAGGVRPAVAVRVDGQERLLELDRADAAVIRRLHVRACLLHTLDRNASVTLRLEASPVRRHSVEYLPGDIVIERRGSSSAEVTLVDLAGSVLLTFEAVGPSLPVSLTPSADVLRVPVRLGSTNRCDAHALANSSQTFLFSIYVRLDHGPAQRVVTFPTAPEKRRLAALIDRACGGGGSSQRD